MVQVAFCSEMSSSQEKHQLSLASTLWIWGIIHEDGLVVGYYYFWADFSEIGTSILLEGDLWLGWPDYFYY